MWSKKSLKSRISVVEARMEKSGKEFRFVLCYLGIHVLCLPSLLGEGLCLALLKAASW